MSTIIGIDPGFRATGLVGLYNKEIWCEVVTTEKSKRKVLQAHDDWARIRDLADCLSGLGGDLYVIEEAPPHAMSARANRTMAMAYAICGTLFRNVPVILLSAQEVKKRLCGKRNASKKDVEEAVKLGMPGEWWESVRPSLREHVFDAAALILAAEDEPLMHWVRNNG